MMKYIPDDLYVDKKNIEKVSKILNSVLDTDLRFPGMKTKEDAAEEIRALGENKVAEFIAK